MRFKDYIKEGIIIPPKLNIKTTDINKLEKQFQNHYISFYFYPAKTKNEVRAAYLADDEDNVNIEVYVYPKMSTKELEALIQHEIIHTIQDDKSAYRMASELQKEFKEREKILNKIKKLCPNDKNVDSKCIKLNNELEQWQTKHNFGTHQEEMAYAYMFVKGRKSENFNDVIKEADKWLKSQGAKMSKRMKKYFGMYWMIKDSL